MKAAKKDAVAGQNRLVTRYAGLWTENEQLRGKLATGKYNYPLSFIDPDAGGIQ